MIIEERSVWHSSGPLWESGQGFRSDRDVVTNSGKERLVNECYRKCCRDREGMYDLLYARVMCMGGTWGKEV